MANIEKLFKSYDLRGTTPELDWKIYYLSAQALVTEVLEKENLPKIINVWHDARNTSDLFYKAFINGLASKGCEIIPCGLGTTDMMYAFTIAEDISGAMITASHNPKDDNGLKVVKKYPQMLGLSSGLDKVRDYVVSNYDKLDLKVEKLKSIVDSSKYKTIAIDKLTEVSQLIGDIINVKVPENYKVVVDAGNGMGGLIFELLKTQYPKIEFVPLYCDIDGSFPNHPADPINPENLKDLQKEVIKTKANLGIAFDGDADRAFFVDEKGLLINGENLVAVFAKELVTDTLTKDNGFNPASVYVVSYSRALADSVLMAGGAAVVSKQGHTFVKSLMKKYNAIYGGEASGHHYFGQFGYMDSGILACNLVFKIMFNTNIVASQLCSYYTDKYYTSGEHNLTAPNGVDINMVIDKVKMQYCDGVISLLDGITVFYPNYKFTIRGSNTEPLFRMNVETKENTKKLNPDLILNKLKKLILS
jgi:phosphomannomutase